MALNLSEAKSFEHTDWPTLQEWLARWYQRSCPRYYESPLRLTHQPHVFKWLIFEEHLCIIKRRQIMGHPVCYLILPPLGPQPVKIMKLFAEHGISTMLSEEDLEAYKISSAEVSIDKNNAEFIYDFNYAERGGINKNQVRRALNDFNKHGERFTITNHQWGIPPDVEEAASALTTRWLRQRGKKAWKHTHFVQAFNQTKGQKCMTVIMESSRCIGYLISIQTANGVVNDTACIDYEDNPLKDTTLVLLHHNAHNWISGRPVNRGAAVRGSGSIAAKRKLRPVKEHQNYKLNVQHKLTKDEYEALWVKPQEEPEWL